MLKRAYSLLHVKAVDAERRVITGTATSPTPDRMGDVVEPLGVSFKNPLPLLLYHDSRQPVGTVKFQKPTKDGIEFEARIPTIDEPGTLKDRVDTAWQSVKAGLLAGVSIGFRALEEAFNKETNGFRFIRSEVLELSLVAIPANPDATIQTVKSLDIGLAALGTEADVAVTPPPSGVSDITRVVKATPQKRNAMRTTFSEQIKDYEATRAAHCARMDAILAKEDGTVPDEAEQQEHDELEGVVKNIDAHLVRLRAAETRQKAAAVSVKGDTAEHASESRGTSVVVLKKELPKGTAFTRYAMALAAGRGSRMEAIEYAKRWENSTPEVVTVLKAAMTAGTTTDSDWAAPLVVYQNLTSEFVELLRPATIIGRIPGLRRVPFNVTMPTQTQGATVGWVGQGKPKPVGELKFDSISLGMAKAAGIIVLSEELVRSSNPSAEAIVRADLIATMAQFLDRQFIDPSVAAVSNVSPASITNGITPVPSSGTNFAALQTDVATLFAQFTAANLSVSGATWIMTESRAQALSMMLNALGQPTIPGITMTGGTMFGLPVVTSENVPLSGGSPDGGIIVLVKAPEILLADDGGVTLDVSREASLQMNSTPDDPATAGTVYVSLWQNNLVGLRAERFINWKRRRAEAVAFIEDANYV